MPVGCLGLSGSVADSSLYLNGEVETSPASRQAEMIEVMQSRLLIQIFRVLPASPASPANPSQLSCPVCSPHSSVCCQTVPGWQVMADLVRANSEAVWNMDLVRAVNTLSYQGYVCPGYLVTRTDSENTNIIQENWTAHSLVSPPQYKIITVGLSQPCTMAPFNQSPSPSLQDAICVVLSRLKVSNTLANMENIICRLKTDYSEIPAPRDFVSLIHRTLGSLIKARKVYYTGKGYFLVHPEGSAAWQEQHRVMLARAGGGGGGGGQDWSSGPEVSRQSPSSPVRVAENGQNTNTSLNSEDTEHNQESPQASHLERSQSFKLSKKVQKTLAKGGSLRLSKKESVTFKEDVDNSKNEEAEEELENESPEPMKRKNSVLGRIFGRKKSSSGSPKKEILTFSAQFPPPDLIEKLKAGRGREAGREVREVGREVHSSTETQTPTQKRKPSLPARPPLPSPASVSTSQVRSGPSGNFVVFERNNIGGQEVRRLSPLSPSLSHRPLPQSPGGETYGHSGHIYSQVGPQSQSQSQSQSQYGTSKPPPPAYVSPPYRASPVSPNKHKQVHFAAPPPVRSTHRESPLRSSPSYRSGSSDGSSSVSGPSSIDSVLYDDSLVVIEKSNQELEQRLGRRAEARVEARVDTIHNNRLTDQEIIFEETSSDMSRSSSVSTLKPDNQPDQANLPDHPSLADLGSIADLSAKFQSLTARKLMAGLSISSIDTLLEVNAANEHHNKLSILNESTETIDFGVI